MQNDALQYFRNIILWNMHMKKNKEPGRSYRIDKEKQERKRKTVRNNEVGIKIAFLNGYQKK